MAGTPVKDRTTVVHYSRLGGPKFLVLVEVERPRPAAGQVHIDVRAVGVNPIDAKLLSGGRSSAQLTKPRGTGTDVAV